MTTGTIPAGHNNAFRATAGQRFRLTTPKRQQSADFLADHSKPAQDLWRRAAA
ncbi:MAG: DUF1989 domain-containing protein [Rhodospirillales bacterium]|nr:DUF1989 domain-containing protein [Rhodospirillales bacterium]